MRLRRKINQIASTSLSEIACEERREFLLSRHIYCILHIFRIFTEAAV